MFVYRAKPLCRLPAAGDPVVNKGSNPRAPPNSQLLTLSHALAAPLYPLFKISGVEAMKGGRGEEKKKRYSGSSQVCNSGKEGLGRRWGTDLFYLFYQ